MGNHRKTNTGLTHAQTSTFRCIGKYNTQIIVLENDQNVKLWDWCLMNAIKAEDDPNQQMLNAYNGSGIRGTNKRSSEILRCSNVKANARCVALLQSSLSGRGLHLIMDLHDVYTMRRRLMDVFGNLQRGQEDSPVLLLLQFQQNQRTLKEYVTEMKRRMEVCKMFDVHLTVREQILALIEGLNSSFTTAIKGQMIEELIENSEGIYGHGFDNEMEIILQFLKGKQKSVEKSI